MLHNSLNYYNNFKILFIYSYLMIINYVFEDITEISSLKVIIMMKFHNMIISN
jgi:hypothetical protein